MADNYFKTSFPFKEGDLLKIDLVYSIFQGNNRIPHKRTMSMLVKELDGGRKDITIEEFLDTFIKVFLVEGFATIQSNLTRWDSIKVTCNGIVIIKFLKEIFGEKSSSTDVQRGFLFELHPIKTGPVSKFYLRGVVNEALFFDKGNSPLLNAITHIETIFINPFQIKDSIFVLQYMMNTDVGKMQIPSEVSAVYGRKLHLFKKKIKQTKINNKFKYI